MVQTLEELSQSKRPATEVLELFPLQGDWTEADYFSLPDTNRFVELSEGRLIILEMPTRSHQKALERLFMAMYAFVDKNALGELHIAPLPVRLWHGKIREPDIVFISNAHADRISEDVWGVPDLAVEVISKSTEQIDRIEKFAEYAQADISEYWLIDLAKHTIEVFNLENRAYILSGKWGLGEIAKSLILIEFEVKVDYISG